MPDGSEEEDRRSAPLPAEAARRGQGGRRRLRADLPLGPAGLEEAPPRKDADELRASELPLYVHAPYLINVCSPRNNVRYGSRKILQQTCDAAAEVGAAAVIVHAGYAEDGIAEGVGRWPRTLEMLESEVPC